MLEPLILPSLRRLALTNKVLGPELEYIQALVSRAKCHLERLRLLVDDGGELNDIYAYEQCCELFVDTVVDESRRWGFLDPSEGLSWTTDEYWVPRPIV